MKKIVLSIMRKMLLHVQVYSAWAILSLKKEWGQKK